MIHPLIRLMVTQPELLAEHLGAYAALVGSEVQDVKARLLKRVLLVAVALCCFGVAVVLTGVSLMLWAVTPVLTTGGIWALILVPGLPAAGAVAAALTARQPVVDTAFTTLQAQLDADARMLADAGAR